MTQPYTRSTPIWIYNKDEQLKLILDPKSDIPHFDSWYVEQLNGAITLEFSVPADDPLVTAIENDGRAVIRDQDGNLVEFIIREPDDTNDASGPIKRVFAEGGDYELIDEWMTGYKANNVTLKTALEAVLSRTRVSVGDVDDFGTQSVDIKPTTVKNSVYQLINLYGAERRYRVDAIGNQITKRYIDALKRRGKFNGKRFEHGKDIQSVRRTIDSTGIKTALYGYGASGANDGPRLTFANVEWSKANGDPVDKPLGQTWIGDPNALQQWGYDRGTRHRFGEYSGQENDPAELLLNTWNHLQTVNDVIRTYEFKVALLEKIEGYEHEKVRLGDTVIGIDRELQPNIEVSADIIEYRQNLNNDQLDEVTVGNFRKVFDAAGRTRSTEQIIDNSRGNWDKKETPEGAQSKANAALAAALLEIDEANKRIDSANTAISDAKNDIQNAQELIDAVTSTDDAGLTVLNGTLVTNEIIAENAILTGTITGNNAIIINLTTEQMTAINADIQNATITGTLSGVDGTFIGTMTAGSIASDTTINVNTNAYVGNDLYLGNGSTLGKKIIFDSGVNIRSNPLYDDLTISARVVDITDGNITLSHPDGIITLKVQPQTDATETGFCGTGGYTWTVASAVSMTGVNFKTKKTYTPSSIIFTQVAGNRSPNFTNACPEGFLLYINGDNGGTGLAYWRGTYDA